MSMTKPQRVRWNRRVSAAEDAVDDAISLLEQTFAFNPVVAGKDAPGETKQDECERLAAECLQEAVGCLEGAKSRLAASYEHINWEFTKDVREFPIKARKLLERIRDEGTGVFAEHYRADIDALLASPAAKASLP